MKKKYIKIKREKRLINRRQNAPPIKGRTK
jgi:hypothetical protein